MGLVRESMFYPERSNVDVSRAKLVCNGTNEIPACPVRQQCLDFALTNNQRYGVWGGTSERERRRLKRRATADKAGRTKGQVA